MLKKLGVSESTRKDERDRILSTACSLRNGRTFGVTDQAELDMLRKEINLIIRIRALYQELD